MSRTRDKKVTPQSISKIYSLVDTAWTFSMLHENMQANFYNTKKIQAAYMETFCRITMLPLIQLKLKTFPLKTVEFCLMLWRDRKDTKGWSLDVHIGPNNYGAPEVLQICKQYPSCRVKPIYHATMWGPRSPIVVLDDKICKLHASEQLLQLGNCICLIISEDKILWHIFDVHQFFT